MAVLEVQFDGDIEDLQSQLDDADLETDATVTAEGEGMDAGDGGGGGLPGGRTAIVGAITAVVGLLTPIKEILKGIRNFFLVRLAPIFSALRPLINFLQDVMIGVMRFLGGDLSLQDILSGIVDALSDVLGDVSVDIPFVGSVGLNTGPGQGDRGTNTGRRVTEDGNLINAVLGGAAVGGGIGFISPDPVTTVGGAAVGGLLGGASYLADRTDEAQKDAMANRQSSQQSESYGGDAGNTGRVP